MRKKLRNKLTVQIQKLNVQSTFAVFSSQLSAFSLVLLIIIIMMACTSREGAHEHSDTYTCPMHPTVVSDKPGVCPVCAMDLVRKGRPGEEVKITEDLAKLIKSPNETVLASIKTMKAEYKSMPLTLSLQGVVTYDTRNIYTIPARVGGRLEKVFLKYNYQPVRKGQKVAEIYSPELVNAQREFLYLMKNDPDNQLLVDAAKSKLLLLGATDKQVADLALKQEVAYTFSMYSPHDGFVISESQLAPTAPVSGIAKPAANSGGMGMSGSSGSTNASASTTTSSSSDFVREGSYVSTGQTLFRIVNIQSLWIEFNIPVSHAAQIKTGDVINWLNGDSEKESKVDFVEPFFSEGEDFVKVRSYYKGSDVTVGQLVDATIQTTAGESLWIPKDALLDLGLDQIVFVKERGSFKARKVESGLRSNDWIQITKGLASSDEFAAQGQYLVDSENFIKTTN
jgi:membrane fusion protein, copper/silver efflux system